MGDGPLVADLMSAVSTVRRGIRSRRGIRRCNMSFLTYLEIAVLQVVYRLEVVGSPVIWSAVDADVFRVRVVPLELIIAEFIGLPSVVIHSVRILSTTARARRTFSRIASALAVHLNALGASLCSSM